MNNSTSKPVSSVALPSVALPSVALPSVALIGAGAMGGALFRGWLNTGAMDAAHSAVFDIRARDDMASLCAENGVALNPSTRGRYDVVVLAVKPQVAAAALPAYKDIAQDALAVSVMAGISIAMLKTLLGASRIARAMPHLPAAIGKGVTGVCGSEQFDDADRACTDALLRAVGEVVWVRTEAEIDAVAAISGSGPAYFFLLTEALAEAGEALGLPSETAALLARATFSGSGALMAAETRSPAEMRQAVTSPGGTTQAALKVLDGDEKALRELMKRATRAAEKRAGELIA